MLGFHLQQLLHINTKLLDSTSIQNVIDELNSGLDSTNELSTEQLNRSHRSSLNLTTSLDDISSCNTFIVTVPTPVTSSKSPDLTPRIKSN